MTDPAAGFRWFEDVRMAVFERVGWIARMEEGDIGPILARTQCVFKRPVTYPDTVTVAAKIEDVRSDRFTMLYRVVSEARLSIYIGEASHRGAGIGSSAVHLALTHAFGLLGLASVAVMLRRRR